MGQENLRDIAWQIFEVVVKSTEISLEYPATLDVTATAKTKSKIPMG